MATQTQSYLYSPRITGVELPKEGRPILITNYIVVDKGNRNYEISLNGIKDPFVQTDWLRQNGTVTRSMAKLLGVPIKTGVSEDLDLKQYPKYSEGLRIPCLTFRIRFGRPWVGPYMGPWDRDLCGKLLIGSAAEGEGRLKIPGVDYFIQPEEALGDESSRATQWETQLYVQEHDLVNFTTRDVNSVARFVQPEEPNKQWLKSELERFGQNGENLKENQIRELYNQLRTDIWKGYWIRPREILAWPLTELK